MSENSRLLHGDSSRPAEPEFQAAQRGRVVFDYEEQGEQIHDAMAGWVRIDGPWLHFYGDEIEGHWQSWPMANIIAVDWEPV